MQHIRAFLRLAYLFLLGEADDLSDNMLPELSPKAFKYSAFIFIEQTESLNLHLVLRILGHHSFAKFFKLGLSELILVIPMTHLTLLVAKESIEVAVRGRHYHQRGTQYAKNV